MTKLVLSRLPKTWFIDVDGVIFVHNSHLAEGDQLLSGIKEFIDTLPSEDRVILVSARLEEFRAATEASLHRYSIRYDQLILGLPVGERILINDEKPDGLKTAIAINTIRDNFKDPGISYEPPAGA